ncbi:MAG: ricin-type beta-trefoil lectin domain protein [Rhodospirillales bacterium]
MNRVSKHVKLALVALLTITGFSFAAPPLEAGNGGEALRFQNVMIRGLGGKCLDVPKAKGGANVRLFDCTGKPNQRWNVYGALNSSTIHILSAQTRKCLSAKLHRNPKKSGNVYMMPCRSPNERYSRQHWKFDKNQIAYLSNQVQCLEVKNAQNKNKADIRIGECKNGHHQRWTLTTALRTQVQRQNFLLKNENGKCLAIERANNKEGANIVYENCAGKPHQAWSLFTDGTIRSLMNGKCLSVYSETQVSSPLQMNTCSGSYKGMWRLQTTKGENFHIIGTRGTCMTARKPPVLRVFADPCYISGGQRLWSFAAAAPLKSIQSPIRKY